MRLIRYIRPTARRSRQWQMEETAGPTIHFTIVDGEEDRDWSTVIKVANKGNGVLVAEPETLGRKIETRCARIRDLASRGIWLVLANRGKYSPNKAESLISWMRAGGDRVKAPRVAHNKTPDEVLAEARKLWTQKQYKRMTNGEVAEVVGLSIPTLTREFGPRSKYIETGPGRPRQ